MRFLCVLNHYMRCNIKIFIAKYNIKIKLRFTNEPGSWLLFLLLFFFLFAIQWSITYSTQHTVTWNDDSGIFFHIFLLAHFLNRIYDIRFLKLLAEIPLWTIIYSLHFTVISFSFFLQPTKLHFKWISIIECNIKWQ